MTRKAGAHRCAVCGHPAGAAGCGRGHGTARSLHGKDAVTPGRGLPPFDLVSGTTDVVRSVFTIVLGRAFVGRLYRPLWVNAISFALLLGLFVFGLLPAFESGAGDRNPAFWAFASWVLLAPAGLELLAGPWQNELRDVAERAMLGPAIARGPPPPRGPRLVHRLAVVVAAVALLPIGLALAEIPWAGLPLAFLLGAALMAFVWFDAAASRCGLALRERAAVIWHNRWRALGVGIGLQIAGAMPFLNLLLLPSLAAVATTSAFVRFDKGPASLPGPP